MATASAQNKAKEQMEKKQEALNQITVIQNTVQEKQQDIHCNGITISNLDKDIAGLNSQKAALETQM